MIDDHNRLIVKTLEGDSLECEVNYSEDPEVDGCKIFRFVLGDKTFHVKREELMALMLSLGDPSMQKRLLPLRVRNVHKVERRLHMTFKAKKDYREGELIEVIAPWIDEVPTEEEILSGNFSKRNIKMLK